MVRIPSEYQEVEYIESTGTQWIDLDFGFDPTDEVYAKFSISTRTYVDKYIVSPVVWNTDRNRFAMGVYSCFACGFGNSTTGVTRLTPNIVNDGNIHEWRYRSSLFEIVDLDSSKDVSAISFGSTSAILRLFYGYKSPTEGRIVSYRHIKQDGTEINLIPCYHKSSGEIGMYDTVSKQFYINSGTGTFLKGNDVTYNNINLLESRRRILLNTPHIETVSDTIASFKTDIATKIKGCKIHFTPTQEGEGDPSPDNVRPIHGWDGVNVTIPKGKNLLISDDPNNPNSNYFHSSTGTIKYSEEENGFYSDGEGVGYPAHAVRNGIYSKLFIAPANMTITFSIEYKNMGTSYGIRFLINNSRLFDIHGSADEIWHKFSHTITMQKDDYIYLIIYKNIYWRNMQIEIGSVASDYEEYIEPQVITIPFPQTIYGGYVDLVKGEVVEEWESFVLDGEENNIREFNQGQSAHRFDFYLTNLHGSAKVASTEWLCNRMTYDRSSTALFGTFRMYNTTNLIIGDGDNTLSDLAAFKQWLSENNPEFCAPLATPNTYSIDPQTLKALRGMNNIWSNANGNIEVSFYTH